MSGDRKAMVARIWVARVGLALLVNFALMGEEVWTSKGRLVSQLLNGQVHRRVMLPKVPSAIDISTSGDMLIIDGDCRSGRQEILLRKRSGSVLRFPNLGRMLPDGVAQDYAEAALSRSGELGALVVRPCEASRRSEASEMAGLVVLLDLKALKAKPVTASVDAEAVPIGVAMRPLFSPSGRYLMVSYETGFTVFDVTNGQSVFSTDEVAELKETWSTGVGWITDGCIALKAGKDYSAADLEPPRLLDWNGPRVRPMVRIAESEVLGLVTASFPYAIRQTDVDWRVVSLVTGKRVITIGKWVPEQDGFCSVQ